MKYSILIDKIHAFYVVATKQSKLKSILDSLSKLETFKDQIDYAEKHLDHLSSGSSRIVYKTSDNTVIKLAKNSKGLAQNKVEAKIKFDSKHINKIIKSDKKFAWIEVPLLEKITEKEFEKISDLNFKEFCDAISHEMSSKKKPKNFDKISKNELFKDVVALCKKYDLLYGDIIRISSWGKKDDIVVLADTGLTTKIYNKFYDKSS